MSENPLQHAGHTTCVTALVVSLGRAVLQERGWGEAVGGKQRKQDVLDTKWSQKVHAAFSQTCSQQVGMVSDQTV